MDEILMPDEYLEDELSALGDELGALGDELGFTAPSGATRIPDWLQQRMLEAQNAQRGRNRISALQRQGATPPKRSRSSSSSSSSSAIASIRRRVAELENRLRSLAAIRAVQPSGPAVRWPQPVATGHGQGIVPVGIGTQALIAGAATLAWQNNTGMPLSVRRLGLEAFDAAGTDIGAQAVVDSILVDQQRYSWGAGLPLRSYGIDRQDPILADLVLQPLQTLTIQITSLIAGTVSGVLFCAAR